MLTVWGYSGVAASATEVFTQEAKLQALDTATGADGWNPPELVQGGVSSTGWEDSADISPDGKTLSFMYVAVDVLAWVSQAGADPARFGEFQGGPDRGNNPPFSVDFFSAEVLPDGSTKTPVRFPFSKDNRSEWGGMRDLEGNWFFVVTELSGFNPDIYRNEDRFPINTSFEEDDPHFDSQSKTLFFDTDNRPDTLDPTNEKKDILMSKETSPGVWSAPVLLNPPINLAKTDDRQAHFTPDGALYFSSDRRGGALAIYKSKRLGGNSWTEPVKVVGPPPELQPTPGGLLLAAVGEPTLTLSGTLYFVALFFHPPTQAFDLDIARMTRKNLSGVTFR